MFASIPFSYKMSPFGDHQRIDRLAYQYMGKHLNMTKFPSIKAILANEGRNGPDGAKYEGGAEGHFYNPKTEGAELLVIIHKYYDALVVALAKQDLNTAAKEASWLAHAVVDGLTPAHQFPYEEAVSTLTADTSHVRDTASKQFYIRGETMGASIEKTWKLTGPQGLLTSHTLFETSMALALQYFRPKLQLQLPPKNSVDEIFRSRARLVKSLELYDKFMRRGPNPSMSLKLRRIVGPAMVEAVVLLWSLALEEANP